MEKQEISPIPPRRNFFSSVMILGAAGLATSFSGCNLFPGNKKLKGIRWDLAKASLSTPIISTHSHFRPDINIEDLFTLFDTSYVGWCEANKADKAIYLEELRSRSYFVWLEKALVEIYEIEEGKITADNFDLLSEKIKTTHQDKEFPFSIYRDKCRYEKAVHDAYWNPGVKFPDPFVSTFRINSFFYGFNETVLDHNGNNARLLYQMPAKNIAEYEQQMFDVFSAKKAEGCVALKCAIAYDRSLHFTEVSSERANHALCAHPSPEAIHDFGNYIAFSICRMAAELDIPLQIHTGLGILVDSNAMQLRELIDKNKKTKFVLFHGGYPWMDDIFALAHNYGNVYPDMCWLPLISSSAAIRFVAEATEVANTEKICWGCDTWTAEEAYGAVMAARYALVEGLAKKVEDGLLSMDTAQSLIRKILYDNAKTLYKL